LASFFVTFVLSEQVVLADKYEKYKMTYSGCHVFNPGSFVGKSFVFSIYRPTEISSEEG
jgi:DNA polymerase epsilon subunit 2